MLLFYKLKKDISYQIPHEKFLAQNFIYFRGLLTENTVSKC